MSFTPQAQVHSPPTLSPALSSRASCASFSNLAELLEAGDLSEHLDPHRQWPAAARTPAQPVLASISPASPPRPAHIRVPGAPVSPAPTQQAPVHHRPIPGSRDAMLCSFDSRRRDTQAVRKSLADGLVGPRSLGGGSGSGSGSVSGGLHPYPPKRAPSSSVAMSHSHVYVYERGNAHAANAMRFLATHTGPGGSGGGSQLAAAGEGETAADAAGGMPGSLLARTQQVMGSAEARAHSLFEQLQQFTVAPKRLQSQSARRKAGAFG